MIKSPPACTPKPRDKFDPTEWSAIYENKEYRNKYLTFWQNTRIVEQICLSITTPEELWADIGCGSGHIAEKLSHMGIYIIGIDHDINMTGFARKRILSKDQGTGEHIHFITARAEELPLGDNTLDGITAVSLMGCLESPEDFFKEAYRVLRKDGFMIATFTNEKSLFIKTNCFITKAKNLVRGYSGDFYRTYDPDHTVYSLKKIGFKVLSVSFHNFFLRVGNRLLPPPYVSVYLERLSPRVASVLGRNFVIVAQKGGG